MPSAPPPAPSTTPVVVEQDGALALRFGDGDTVHTRIVPGDPTRLALEYTRLLMGVLLFQPAPRRIAMIGLGGGALASYCTRTLPDVDFTAIEIAPAVIALRERFGLPPDGPRFRVRCADGAAFVREEGAPLDVLLVDGFDHAGLPPSLSSVAFYDACRARLAPGGVLALNLYTDADTPAVLDRLRDAFAGLVVAIDADGTENTIAFAGAARPFPPPFATLVANLRAGGAAHPHLALDATLRKILDHRAPRDARRRLRDHGRDAGRSPSR